MPAETRVEAPNALIEAAGVLLEKAGGKLLTTSLNKALFYFELQCLLETGRTVTGATFVALRAGPVVESYSQDLIAGLERSRVATQDSDNPDYKPVVLMRRVEPKWLTNRQIELANDVARWAHSEKATSLSMYSHENPGWCVAYEQAEGTSINMYLAMQQLLDDDPWVENGDLAPEERAALEGVDDLEENPW